MYYCTNRTGFVCLLKTTLERHSGLPFAMMKVTIQFCIQCTCVYVFYNKHMYYALLTGTTETAYPVMIQNSELVTALKGRQKSPG